MLLRVVNQEVDVGVDLHGALSCEELPTFNANFSCRPDSLSNLTSGMGSEAYIGGTK
jgi:hypothetical protein